MTNTGAAGAPAPKTPPHGVDSGSELKSTPLAVGSATVSEHISTVGVKYVQISFHCSHYYTFIQRQKCSSMDRARRRELQGMPH
jgi:hypothetical protein